MELILVCINSFNSVTKICENPFNLRHLRAKKMKYNICNYK